MGEERVEQRGRMAGQAEAGTPAAPESRGIGLRESQLRVANISSASTRQPSDGWLTPRWPGSP